MNLSEDELRKLIVKDCKLKKLIAKNYKPIDFY